MIQTNHARVASSESLTGTEKWPAFHQAAWRGDISAVKYLLPTTTIDARDADNYTALHWAAQGGHDAVAEFLLSKAASVQTENKDRKTPLHLAAFGGSLAIVCMLLDRGACIDAADGTGQTPLQCAAKWGYEGIVRVLLERGADPRATDHWGFTATRWAAVEGHRSIMELLRQYKALTAPPETFCHTSPRSLSTRAKLFGSQGCLRTDLWHNVVRRVRSKPAPNAPTYNPRDSCVSFASSNHTRSSLTLRSTLSAI